MTKRLNRGNLRISETLVDFIEKEALPNTNINVQNFWNKFELILDKFVPQNKKLLQTRNSMKKQIDEFYINNSGKTINQDEYISFLKEINYIVPVGKDFKIETQNVDSELAVKAGPQLVVPVTNARYALNAANARWGSLYDALYGTDVIPDDKNAEKTISYNPLRGEKVVDYAKDFLDKTFPLENGSHKNVLSYKIIDNALIILLSNGSTTEFRNTN